MPRDIAAIEAEKTELLKEKLDLDSEIATIRNQIATARQKVGARREYADQQWWRRANDALAHKGRRSQEIQLELSKLRIELNRLRHGGGTKPPSPVTPQARTAVLFQVAHAAERFLYDDGNDEDAAGDRLERALDELEYVAPGWRTHPSMYRKAS